MTLHARFLLTLSLLAALLLTGCSPPPEQRLLTETTMLGILPAYRDFSGATQQLRQGSEYFCAATEDREQAFQALHSLWKNAATTWAAVQTVQFGPLMVDNQAWKVQFWPDRKNLVARKVDGLLQGDDVLDVARVEEASVVAQGLSALEYLLFDDTAGKLEQYRAETGPRRCKLLMAVSTHLEGVALHLLTAWQPEGGNYSAVFSQPGENNTEYPQAKVAIGTLVDSLVYGLEQIKRDKLERPLGLSGSAPQVYFLEWWRSRYSMEAVAANLSALQRLYKAGGGYGLDDYLTQALGEAELAEKIDRKFEEALRLANAVDRELFENADHPETQAAVKALVTAVNQLEGLAKNQLPAALGVTLGFNSSDGD